MIDYRQALQVLRANRVFMPALVYYEGQYHIFERTNYVCSGSTIESALRRGGFWPLPEGAHFTPYTVDQKIVMRRGDNIAIAKSATIAQRIANALNNYTPGKRKV